jgi:hypothetical protein
MVENVILSAFATICHIIIHTMSHHHTYILCHLYAMVVNVILSAFATPPRMA